MNIHRVIAILLLFILAIGVTLAKEQLNNTTNIGESQMEVSWADPSFIVTSPNGGESWKVGTTYKVSWVAPTGNPGPYVRIDLFKSGVLVDEIASNTPNNGQYYWTIPSGRSPGTDYRIRITSTNDPSCTDTSDKDFTISLNGKITVISPNWGEVWARETYHTIKWSSTGSIGANVKIELLKNWIVVGTVTSSTPNDGSYSWKISPTRGLASDYRIRVTSTIDSTVTDTSDDNFFIGGINVLSPNGGENWARGTTHTITWNSFCSPGPNVRIDLLKSGLVVGTVTSGTINDGSHPWTISTGRAPGTDYKIRIMSTSNSAYKHTSEYNFRIS